MMNGDLKVPSLYTYSESQSLLTTALIGYSDSADGNRSALAKAVLPKTRYDMCT